MTQDGIELARVFCKHLGTQNKIIRPSVIPSHDPRVRNGSRQAGALYAIAVGTGQGSGTKVKNYSAAYDALLQKAQCHRKPAGHRRSEARRASSLLRTARGYGVQRKWSNKFEGAYEFLYGTIGLALVGTGRFWYGISTTGSMVRLLERRAAL